MATPHLLAAIHMIERTRMNNLIAASQVENLSADTAEYYSKFPPEYRELCDEAERRFLIARGSQKDGLIKRS